MLTRPLALLCAVAILAGLFLPWLATPLGSNLTPWDVLPAFDRDPFLAYLRDSSREVLVFLCSFVLAALFALLALVGFERRWLAFLTGLSIVGLAGTLIWRARDSLGIVEPKWTTDEASRLFALASDVLGPGGWAWISGGTVLLLLGVFDPGRSRSVRTSRW